jgi:hypothetical protein
MVKGFGKVVFFACVTGCNVASPPGSTGGISGMDGGRGDGGAACATALSILCTDFMSTNIAVARVDGTTLSGSFVSSGSTEPGLSLALSGDVDVPFVPPASGRLVVIDRYGANVVTWMDVTKATVLGQLVVGTGFNSNPQDYVEVDAKRAFVSRYGNNAMPGHQQFDQGGDLLVLDTSQYAVTGRIAMPEENAALQPCPGAMNWLGEDVVVTLGRFSSDFSQEGDGRFVGVSPSTNAVAWTVNIAGLQNCGRVVLSPSGKTAAIACSSKEDTTTSAYDPSHSDIVLYDATKTPPVETRRLGLGAKLGAGIQPQIVFASETKVVGLTYGGNATPGDTAFAVDTATGDVTQLAAATMPYSLAGLHCAPGCGDVCVLADAEHAVLRRWTVDGGALTSMPDVTVDPTVGLPPRDIGGLL